MIAKWPRLRRENYSLAVVSEKVRQASTSTVRNLSVVSPDYPIDEIGSLCSAIAERRSFSSLKYSAELATRPSAAGNNSVPFLKCFPEGTKFQLHCPCAAILMRKVPIALGYRVGAEHVFLAHIWSLPVRQVDLAVDIDPGHMYALWPQVSRQ